MSVALDAPKRCRARVPALVARDWAGRVGCVMLAFVVLVRSSARPWRLTALPFRSDFPGKVRSGCSSGARFPRA